MSTKEDDFNVEVREHAWNWFSLHATQRMQCFNFFLVSTAFLIAGYATLLEKHPIAACVVAFVGAWVAYWFNRLDLRTRQLIHAAEDVLKIEQTRLFEKTGTKNIKILEIVDNMEKGASSYKTVISNIQKIMIAIFISAGLYSLFTKFIR